MVLPAALLVALMAVWGAGSTTSQDVEEAASSSSTSSNETRALDETWSEKDDNNCGRYPTLTPAKWWYNNKNDDRPHRCMKSNDEPWTMLNAYRSGGEWNVHWKYTDDPNDPECLTDWTYYRTRSTLWLAKNIPRLTTIRSDTGKPWCALPVYRSGGIKGALWEDCYCD